MVRILHISDVHLGRRFSGFGDFGSRLRQQVRETFTRLMCQTPGRYDLVLLAGDIFDSNRPDPRDLAVFLKAVASVCPVPVFLLPGTHDRFSAESVYRRTEFCGANRPANLRLFDSEAAQTFFIEELSVAVHGRANLISRGGVPPLTEIRPDPRAAFNIAVAHASVPLPAFEADDDHDYYVRQEDAMSSGMQYIALGHWHRFQQCFPGESVSVWYAGSPECVGFDGPSARGTAAAVQLCKSKAEVTRLDSGRYLFTDLEINMDGLCDDQPIRQTLQEKATLDTVLRLTLAGRPAPHFRAVVDSIEEEFAERFAYLEIRDHTRRTIKVTELRPDFMPDTIGDAFCQLVDARMKNLPSEERLHYSEVLRRGTALLLEKEGAQP